MVKFSGVLFKKSIILIIILNEDKNIYIFLYKQCFLIECYLPARYDLKHPYYIKQSYIIHYYASILGITFDTFTAVLYTTSFL